MEEKKLTDEAVNATVKSLKWVCNQIPNDLGNSNEEKMLKCIQLYCQQGIAVIERLQSENKELKSPKFASWKLKFFNLKEEFDKELAEHEEFTKKAKAEIERLKKFEMYRIKAMKKDKDEIERLTADLISMDREHECYIARIKELDRQVDEFVKIARVSDTKKLIDGIKEQTVKDTAKEIFSFIVNQYDGEYFLHNVEQFIAEKYGVEVE